MASTIEDFYFYTEDGLKLHALRADHGKSERLPAVCLPGVSRTAEDFRTLIGAFADGPSPRHAFALDSRGRGLSARDPNSTNYSVAVELNDLIAFLTAMKITRAVFTGTSRGGILTMLLASIAPQMIAGAVLNDVGPVLDMTGLMRIKGYVGKLRKPRSWPEAVASLKTVMAEQFPAFGEDDWLAFARRTWMDDFEPRSDPAIGATFANLDAANPPPSLWPQFEALAAAAPVLVLRGEHSDLLSPETVAEMKRRAARIQAIKIPGQGHAPVLEDPKIIGTILDFATGCDSGR